MPLKKIKVLELAGLAPAPFCGMILADFGATVIKIDKTGSLMKDVLSNGKRSIALNLKNEEGNRIFRELSDQSDIVIDPFRKGVMEKLQLGPDDLMKTNKKLIYARLTGFGQDGPYATMAGHDINYLALSGILSLFGRSGDKPTPPINYAADFAGGGLICALGILMALYERTQSQLGQVIDAAMVEGSAYVASWIIRSIYQMPILWSRERGQNVLDTGTHFYETYETKDGKYMAVGALEPQFYAILLEKLGLTDEELPQFSDFEKNKEQLAEIFQQKTQAAWTSIFEGTDACVTPVLSLTEASNHVHNKARKSFFTMGNNKTIIPNPSPKLNRTPGFSSAINHPNVVPGEHSREILAEYGFNKNDIDNFIASGVIQQVIKQSKL